jgi:cyclopropane fatty-acyl-phospholipid synthase-like methyltransferase
VETDAQANNYDPEWVSRYFDENGETEWNRMLATPIDEISLHLHTEFLREHLRPGMEVLEIGAAAGRFTQILAEMGCRITATDLSTGQLDLNRRKAEEFGFESAIAGRHRLDMCDMACFPDESFDAVVSFGGPLSYVFEKADLAMAECARVLKTGGPFLCSVMSLLGASNRFLPSVFELTTEQSRIIFETGDLTPLSDPKNHHWCHMFRSPELRELLERHGLTVLEMSSSGFLSGGWSEKLTEFREDPSVWNELLRLERHTARQPGCLDTGTHLIAVGRRTKTRTT